MFCNLTAIFGLLITFGLISNIIWNWTAKVHNWLYEKPVYHEVFFVYNEDQYPSRDKSFYSSGQFSHEVMLVDDLNNMYSARYNYDSGKWELGNARVIPPNTRIKWMYKPKILSFNNEI